MKPINFCSTPSRRMVTASVLDGSDIDGGDDGLLVITDGTDVIEVSVDQADQLVAMISAAVAWASA